MWRKMVRLTEEDMETTEQTGSEETMGAHTDLQGNTGSN